MTAEHLKPMLAGVDIQHLYDVASGLARGRGAPRKWSRSPDSTPGRRRRFSEGGRGGRNRLWPIRLWPSLAKPTLAKPTLANVKVLVVCKDFGFWELIVFVF